jgi:hypothetical protein
MVCTRQGEWSPWRRGRYGAPTAALPEMQGAFCASSSAMIGFDFGNFLRCKIARCWMSNGTWARAGARARGTRALAWRRVEPWRKRRLGHWSTSRARPPRLLVRYQWDLSQ